MSETVSAIPPGACRDCGGRIGSIRLFLLPSTTRGMACELAAEATAGGGRWVREEDDDRRPPLAERDRPAA